MSDYAAKSDLKTAADIDTSKCAKMYDLASLKSDVGELDIGKLKTVTDDLSKLTNTSKSDVVKKTIWWIGKKKLMLFGLLILVILLKKLTMTQKL